MGVKAVIKSPGTIHKWYYRYYFDIYYTMNIITTIQL